jgi:glycosyltransferase involved in cell wall biosynthesis
VAIEALKARLPVVARRVGGIPEVLLNSKNAILFNKDSELIEIINKHNYLGETDWQDERFQIDTMVLNTLQIYDK